MILAHIVGHLTKDSEVRDTDTSQVTAFSVATNTKVKGEEAVFYIDCSLWGKRGQALSQYLVKGKQVMVSGELTTRVYKEKTYLEMRVDQVELLGGGRRGEAEAAPKGGRKPEHRTTKAGEYKSGEDEIPF